MRDMLLSPGCTLTVHHLLADSLSEAHLRVTPGPLQQDSGPW